MQSLVGPLASMNKYLAQINKSPDGGKATKGGVAKASADQGALAKRQRPSACFRTNLLRELT